MNKENNHRTLVGLRVTIEPRGKRGIYTASFHYQGKHCRRSLKTTCQKAARRKALRLEQQLEDGTFQTQTREHDTSTAATKLSDAIASFTEYQQTEGKRPKTVVKYRGILTRFSEFTGEAGVESLPDVNVLLVDRYRSFRKPNLSEKSMCHEGVALRLFFAWGVERGMMAANPLANRKFKSPESKPRGGPTLKQIDEILKLASDVRRPVIATAAFAGMRIGEIMRLRVEDVDLKNNWLHVISRPGYETKSGDDWKVPIHPRLRKVLERVAHGKSGWFFTAQPSRKYPHGEHHINPKHANEDFVKVLDSLGIPSGRDGGFTFHSLRSSFKTFCINAGVPKEVVDVWQNHAPDRAASNVYYKLSDADSQAFMLKIPFGSGE